MRLPSPNGRRGPLRILALVAVLTLGVGAGTFLSPGSASGRGPLTYSIWNDAAKPVTAASSDTSSVEIGLEFRVREKGWLSSVRFYRASANKGPFVVKVWSSKGELLTSQRYESPHVGWQTVRLSSPVPVVRGGTYVASYRAPNGRYAGDNGFFRSGRVVTTHGLTAVKGVYSYSDEFPTKTYNDTNYYVDVTFSRYRPLGGTPTSAPSPSASEASTKPSLVRVDGGTSYYSKFPGSFPSDPTFFPIGVWYESVVEPADVGRDKAAGLNLYVELTNNSDLTLLSGKGMYALPSWMPKGSKPNGYLTSDEVDMWAGDGNGKWTGNYPGQGDICSPSSSRCGFTVMDTLLKSVPKGYLRYTNYGKGVTFWQSDASAAQFVNDYQDVVSVDTYWFTDPNICGYNEGGGLISGTSRSLTKDECRRASNYGASIDRVRSLVSPVGSKPVWGFVEVGHPFTEDDAPTITGPEIRAAVWSSLIHGARGIVYFNHNFGGDCQSQHVLRDSCGALVRPVVTAVNRQVKQLAPVLNSPTAKGVVSAAASVDMTVKLYGGEFYVLAGSKQKAGQTATFKVGCGATAANVVDENRTITITNGQFSDRFTDGNAVHVYRLQGGTTCGLK